MKIISTLSTLVSSLVLVSFISACDEKPKEKGTSGTTKAASIESTPQIEIVSNENAKEIKVKEKKVDKTQSKSYYYDYNIKSEYDENAKPANEDAGIRAKPRTSIDANINVRSPYEEVQISMMVKKLSKKFIVKCSACHNDYANGIIGPSLLGKTSQEIFDAIAAFKSGEKENVLMTDLINMMDEDEIKTLADEIYDFNQKINEARK